jgi:hypothetical protein
VSIKAIKRAVASDPVWTKITNEAQATAAVAVIDVFAAPATPEATVLDVSDKLLPLSTNPRSETNL